MVNYYITTDQDNIRKSKHALPYRCRRERARNANIASICTLKHGKKWKWKHGKKLSKRLD